MPKSWRLPCCLTGFFLLSQAFPLPAVVRDAATGSWVKDYSLHLPTAYIFFAPFCGIADRLTLLSFNQALVALGYVFLTFFLFMGWRRVLVAAAGFIIFLAWVILVPHPMAQLTTPDPDVLLIDFHSHSNVSHDGRPSFTAEGNMRWHQLQGYDAAFITDHNRVENTQKAKAISREEWSRNGYRSLEGQETSLWKTHLVVLGNHERIDNQPYDSDPKQVPLFIRDMHRKGLLVIASLPEYWWYHWTTGTPAPSTTRLSQANRYAVLGDGGPRRRKASDPRWGDIQDFIRWNIDGFEIANSAPKALDFPPAYRKQIVELCEANNLFMSGISDNHGYGYATAVWNAVRLPAWRQLDPDHLEAAVIGTLQIHRFSAVQVLERARYNPESVLGVLGSPWIDALLYWRLLQWPEVLSWILWIWTLGFIIPNGYRRFKITSHV